MVENSGRLNSNLRIIHITESLGGGVLNSMIGLIETQNLDNCHTEIHYVARSDTPTLNELKDLFGKQTKLTCHGRSNLTNLISLFKVIKNSHSDSDIIHLHSSKAGLLGRIMLRKVSNLFYSPHAFAFTRKDISTILRVLYRWLEYLSDRGSNCKTLGVSKHESLLATQLKFHEVATLYNFIADPVLQFEISIATYDMRSIDVCNLARFSAQKNPERFSRVHGMMSNPGKWVWIGAGNSQSFKNKTDLEITGWKSRTDSMKYLNNSKVFLSTSDWEGLSMSLIEAQMMGLPAIAWDIPSNREIILNGESGYLCTSETEMALRIYQILSDKSLWNYLSLNARKNAISNFEKSNNKQAWKIAYFE